MTWLSLILRRIFIFNCFQIQIVVQLGEKRKVFSIETANFQTLQQAYKYVKGQFDLPKSKQMYLQRFDHDSNEYIDINQMEDVKSKDKLLVVVVKDEKGLNQENSVKVKFF